MAVTTLIKAGSFDADLVNQLNSNFAAVMQLSPSGAQTGNLNLTGTIQASKASTSTTADDIAVTGTATVSATGITAGNINGTKGVVNLTGTVTGAAYISAAYGKLVITGTQNHADSRLQAGFFKVDASAGTITAGFLQAIWADMGATGPAGGWGSGVANIIKATNTTSGAVNSIYYGYGKATYAFDLSDNGGGWIVGTAAASGWDKSLKINVNGTTYYIPLNPAAA